MVRAFDARTGALRRAFDLAPPGFDYATRPTSRAGYALGTPNVWAPMASDPERDLIFVPTGNPAPDYYRGSHPDMDHHGSSVVALRGSTGEVVWSFQTVHHDLLDYDVPAQPTLIDLTVDGRSVPALVQGTKMGFLFVLNRETGEPVCGVTVDLPDPFTNLAYADRVADVTEFAFFDGVRTLDDTQAFSTLRFRFSTDGSGNLQSWELVMGVSTFDVIALADFPPNFLPQAFSAAALSIPQMALNDQSAGTWQTTLVPQAVPSVTPLGLAILTGLLAICAWQRLRA